jgi:hypothetical protein
MLTFAMSGGTRRGRKSDAFLSPVGLAARNPVASGASPTAPFFVRVSSTDYLASCGDGAAIRAVLDSEATSAAVTPEPDDVAASDRDRRSPDRARLRIRSFVHDGERHALLVRRADGPAPGQRVRDTEALGAIGRLAADLAGSLPEVGSRAAIEELVASRIADLAADEAAWTVSGTPTTSRCERRPERPTRRRDSPRTFHQHLRVGLEKLLGPVYGSEEKPKRQPGDQGERTGTG